MEKDPTRYTLSQEDLETAVAQYVAQKCDHKPEECSVELRKHTKPQQLGLKNKPSHFTAVVTVEEAPRAETDGGRR